MVDHFLKVTKTIINTTLASQLHFFGFYRNFDKCPMKCQQS